MEKKKKKKKKKTNYEIQKNSLKDRLNKRKK